MSFNELLIIIIGWIVVVWIVWITDSVFKLQKEVGG